MHEVDRSRGSRARWILITLTMFAAALLGRFAPGSASLEAQNAEPEVVEPNLAVRTVASSLVTPISFAFLGANDLLVLEKDTGRVRRVVDNAVQSTVLDLAVNNGSERGLLGITLHPDFPSRPWVYLY